MSLKIVTGRDEDKLIENIYKYFESTEQKYTILNFSTCGGGGGDGVTYSILLEYDEKAKEGVIC